MVMTAMLLIVMIMTVLCHHNIMRMAWVRIGRVRLRMVVYVGMRV